MSNELILYIPCLQLDPKFHHHVKCLMKKNIIRDKSITFSLEIIKIYKLLINNKEFVISKQLLRSATSIGANIAEADGAISRNDFSSKISIAYKESRETQYWLQLLHKSNYIHLDDYSKLQVQADEISKILFSILKTTDRIRTQKKY